MSFNVFLAYFDMFFWNLPLQKASLHVSCYAIQNGCHLMPPFLLSATIILVVLDLSVLTVFFCGETRFRSSRFVILTFCAELLSFLLHVPLFRAISLNVLSFRKLRLEETSARLGYCSTISYRNFSHISSTISHFFDFPWPLNQNDA